MCFSATVSFVVGSSLSIIGLLSLSYAKQLKERMLAAIPFFFGIQQIAEGVVWKGMESNNEFLITYGAYTFLFFAFFFWPAWVPLTMLTLEPYQKRKKALKFFFLMGLVLGCYLIHHIVTNGILVEMFNCHIKYSSNFDQHRLISMIAYLIVTVVPFFIVLNPLVNLMGLAVAGSYLVTYFFYTEVLISVWCFFAAVISIFSIALMYQLQTKKRRKK